MKKWTWGEQLNIPVPRRYIKVLPGPNTDIFPRRVELAVQATAHLSIKMLLTVLDLTLLTQFHWFSNTFSTGKEGKWMVEKTKKGTPAICVVGYLSALWTVILPKGGNNMERKISELPESVDGTAKQAARIRLQVKSELVSTIFRVIREVAVEGKGLRWKHPIPSSFKMWHWT